MKSKYDFKDVALFIITCTMLLLIFKINLLEKEIESDLEDLSERVTYIEQTATLPIK